MEQSKSISIELVQNQETDVQIQSDLLVLYGIQGKNVIIAESKRYELLQGGLLVMNPFAQYTLSCDEKSSVMIIHVPQKILQIAGFYKDGMRADCYIAGDFAGATGQYDQIRILYAEIFQAYFQGVAQNETHIVSSTIQLLSIIMDNFLVADERDDSLKDHENILNRYKRIMNYIHLHWNEQITLKEIAQEEYLSIGYLTRFFKKYTGTTFTTYLVNLRTQNAISELLSGNSSTTEIAYNSGFNDVNLFIKYFKERYGQTPKQYRKNKEEKKSSSSNVSHAPFVEEAYPETRENGISILLQYAQKNEQSMEPKTEPLPVEKRNIKVRMLTKDCSEDIPLRHTWRKLINIGYARDGLMAEIQARLKQAQDEIGFEYLCFHGILDDDMHLYYQDEDGEPFLEFSYIDMLFDFILSIGLKPYIELSNMPELLAKEKLRVYDRVSFHSIYRDEDERKWRFLIQGLLQHFVERYGLDNVRQWRFTTMGIYLPVFADGVTLDSYLTFYQVTYESVKAVDAKIHFGGFGGFTGMLLEGGSFWRFLAYVIENQCIPDFICIQGYPYSLLEKEDDFLQFTITQVASPAMLSGDEHFIRTMLHDLKKVLAVHGLSHLDVWIEEWNSTLWQRDLSSETCYKSAWLTKNICENYDDAEAFGYWLLSDLLEERAAFRSTFHGGYGLFTYNGIPKSGWRAMQLLNRIGDTKLASGEGFFVTKNHEGIQIVLSHYCHYDKLYRFRYKVLSDPKQAYSVFVQRGGLKFLVNLSGLVPGQYNMHKYAITPEQGSSFDTWTKMGAPASLLKNEIDYLDKVSQPSYSIQPLNIDEEFAFESLLQPHEVQVILLTPLTSKS
ncbi:helix-turn-helix domain-containing protein [Lachnospiraceae bacterium ZAX-1]